MNKLLKIGMAGGLVFGIVKLLKMKRVSDKMVRKLSNPRVHKVDLTGIVFRTEINIQNPTKDSMTITKPVVTLLPMVSIFQAINSILSIFKLLINSNILN